MWFAVDRDGHLAGFDPGDTGAVPTDGDLGDGDVAVVEALLDAGGAASEVVVEHAPAAPRVFDLDPPPLAEAGVYVYRHAPDHPARPYRREQRPRTPLPGHQVPRGILARMVGFEGRFADAPTIDPTACWPCLPAGEPDAPPPEARVVRRRRWWAWWRR